MEVKVHVVLLTPQEVYPIPANAIDTIVNIY